MPKRRSSPLTDEGLHPRDSWTWAELAAQNEQLGDMGGLSSQPRLRLSPPHRCLLMTRPLVARLMFNLAPLCRRPPHHMGPSLNRKPWTTNRIRLHHPRLLIRRRTSPMRPRDLEGAISTDDVAETTHWLVQGTKVHLIRGETEGRLLPWCRDATFLARSSIYRRRILRCLAPAFLPTMLGTYAPRLVPGTGTKLRVVELTHHRIAYQEKGCLRPTSDPSFVRVGIGFCPVWVVHSPFSPGRGPSVAGRPSCFRLCPDGVGGGACRPLAHDWLGREGGLVAVFLDGQPPGF